MRKIEVPLAILSRILAQLYVTPLPEYMLCKEGLCMQYDCASIPDGIAKGTFCYSHDASL